MLCCFTTKNTSVTRRCGRFLAAFAEAEQKIERNPAGGLIAPRPYPGVARPDRAWVKAGRYWINYRTTLPPVIVGVFFDTADIPNRM